MLSSEINELVLNLPALQVQLGLLSELMLLVISMAEGRRIFSIFTWRHGMEEMCTLHMILYPLSIVVVEAVWADGILETSSTGKVNAHWAFDRAEAAHLVVQRLAAFHRDCIHVGVCASRWNGRCLICCGSFAIEEVVHEWTFLPTVRVSIVGALAHHGRYKSLLLCQLAVVGTLVEVLLGSGQLTLLRAIDIHPATTIHLPLNKSAVLITSRDDCAFDKIFLLLTALLLATNSTGTVELSLRDEVVHWQLSRCIGLTIWVCYVYWINRAGSRHRVQFSRLRRLDSIGNGDLNISVSHAKVAWIMRCTARRIFSR